MDSLFSTEEGYRYYTLPKGYPLYKASRESKESMNLVPGNFYFFGVKNDNPDYIKGYEENYGIIFEFRTTREYKLLAMDTPKTLKTLYKSASPEIRKILKTNYGYRTGIRDSNSEQDRKLSAYICDLGFDGYAIDTMKTPAGGTFHSEFMICKMSNIEFVGRVSDEISADKILAKEKLDKQARELREQRRRNKTRKSPTPPSPSSKSPLKKSLFDSPMGSYKSPKRMTSRSLFGNSPSPRSNSPLRRSLFDTPPKSQETSPIVSHETPSSSSHKKTKRNYTPTPDK
jgi:hypothetical protein